MLKPLRKILLTIFGIMPMMLPLEGVRAAEKSESEQSNYLASASELPWRKARLSLEAQTGTRTVGTLDAMIPFMGNDDLLIYVDLMGQAATSDKALTGSLGLGFRRVNDAETSIFGLYAFYDVLKSVNNNQFSQVTVGAERLGLTWDFRANAYLPVGKTKYNKTIYEGSSADVIGNDIIQYVQAFEEQLSVGGDLEVGRTLGSNNVRGYVAAYTFGQNLTGPRTRVEYQINPTIALNATVQYDQARKTQYFLGARFTVGGAKTSDSNSIYTRLTEPVVRNLEVVTKSGLTYETRVATDKFWMVDQGKTTSGGNGTVADPFANLQDAIAAAPENAIIYVKGTDGTLTTSSVQQASQGIQLKAGHVLVGGDQDLHFDFETNSAYYAPTSKSIFLMSGNGVRPTIKETLIANSNVGIYNLDIIASGLAKGQSAITVANAQGVIISDVSVSGFNAENGAGISVTDNSQVSFNNVGATNNYIGISVVNSQVKFSNGLTIDQSQHAGLQLNNSQVVTDNVNITNSAQNGIIAVGGNLTVSNNLSITGGSNAIVAQSGAVINADSTNISSTALLIDGGQFINKQNASINVKQILLNNGVLNLQNGSLTVAGSATDGLMLQNGSSLNVQTLVAQNNAANGVLIDNSNVTINGDAGLTATLNGTNGIVVQNNGTLQAGNITTTQNSMHGVVLSGGAISSQTINTTQNANDGVFVSGGTITATKKVIASNNGREATPDQKATIGNGLVMIDGSVNFAAFEGSNNRGAGVLQSAGSILMEYVLLNANTLGDGMTQTGGNAKLYNVTVTGNAGNGVTLKGADSNFYAYNVALTNNVGKGVLLTEGQANLVNVTITGNNSNSNQVVVSDAATEQTRLTITSDTISSNIISAGTISDDMLTPQEQGAILLQGDATVLIENTNISNNTGGYGVWVDGGQVTLSNIQGNANDSAVILTQGHLTLKNSTFSANTQYGVVAYDKDSLDPITHTQRTLNLTNVNLINTVKGYALSLGAGYGLAILDDTTVNFDNSGLASGALQVTNNAAGGIYIANGNVNLNTVKIHNNTGMGVMVDGSVNSDAPILLTASNSFISNDSPLGAPGKQTTGISVNGTNATVNLANTKFINNTEAGLVISEGATFACALGNCEIQGSKNGIIIDRDNVVIQGFNLHKNDQALVLPSNLQQLNLTLDNTKIYDNKIEYALDVTLPGDINLTLKNGSVVMNNQDTGIKAVSTSGAVNIVLDNIIYNNKATALNAVAQKDVTITLQNGAVINGSQNAIVAASTAGAVNVTLDHAQIINGKADGLNLNAQNNVNVIMKNSSVISGNQGAGIKASSTAGVASVTVTDSIISANKGSHGIDISGLNSSVNLLGATIENNKLAGVSINAQNNAILFVDESANNATTMIQNNGAEGIKVFSPVAEFTVNKANIIANGTAGIWFKIIGVNVPQTSPVKVSNSTISRNGGDGVTAYAEGYGRGLVAVDVSNTTIDSNSGQGIYLGRAGYPIGGVVGLSLQVQNSQITNNRVGIQLLAHSWETVTNISDTLIANSKYVAIDTFENTGNTNINLKRVNIENNAGGILIQGGKVELSLDDTHITGNQRGAFDADLYIAGGYVYLTDLNKAAPSTIGSIYGKSYEWKSAP